MGGRHDFFSPRIRFSFLIFISIAVISLASLKNGYFYDDEIYTIKTILANDYISLSHYINQYDVHPPGSYLLIKFLFSVFGSFEAVKLFSGLLNAFALAVFGFLAFPKVASGARLPLAILLMLSATTVMWGASIRWYAYFDPVFAIALGILLFSDLSLTTRSIILGIACVILLHLSYAALCAAPVLLVVHLWREKDNLKRSDIVILLLVGLLGLAVCAPQLRIFLRFVGADNGVQTGSFFAALPQITMTLLVGNAVFPVAVAPALYVALVGALGAYFLFIKPKSRLDWIVFTALLVGTLAMVATGIAIKPRNSVFLLPLVFLLIASAIAGLPAVLGRAALAAVAIFQLIGVVDVITHRGTIKGGFDADYKSALATIKGWKQNCKGALTVFNHDMALNYLLEQNLIATSSPFAPSAATLTLSPGDCAVAVKTYHGVFSAAATGPLYQAMDNPALKQRAAVEISEDPNAAMKSRIGHEPFPAYLIELRDYDVIDTVVLPAWRAAAEGDSPADGVPPSGAD